MKAILTAAAFLAVMCVCVGCGDQAVPGGTATIQYDHSKGALFVKTNRDSAIEDLTFNIKTGEVRLHNYSGNGSNIGAQQMQWSIVESGNRRAVIGDIIGLVKEVAAIYTGGGAVVPGGGVVTPPADLTTLKATLTTRINACPVLATNTPLRDLLLARVAGVDSAAGAAVLQGIVDDLYKQMVPK